MPCATFFPLHDRAVSPTQGTEHRFRGVMFPSHGSCCAFSLSLSVFSGPFPNKRSQAPQCPRPCHRVRADTNQRTWNLSEHNTAVSPAGHFQAMPRAGNAVQPRSSFFMPYRGYNRLLYCGNLDKERKRQK